MLFRSVEYKKSSEVLKQQFEDFKQNQKNILDQNTYQGELLSFEREIKEIEKDTTTNFGFIAQELREIYPNLVFEDEEGYLSVNYIGLIPVLLEAIKELKSEINDLKGKDITKNPTNFVASDASVLCQNIPNPFNEKTEIKYYIPENSSSASIIVYDLTGSQIVKFDLFNKGYSSITINGNELKAGMYIYALLVDGKEIDTKRMILTK